MGEVERVLTQAERQQFVNEVRHDAAMEGLTLDPDARAFQDAWVAGEIDLKELQARTLAWARSTAARG